MKTVVLLSIDDVKTLQESLHDAKLALNDCYESPFYVGVAERNIARAIDILTEKGGVQE